MTMKRIVELCDIPWIQERWRLRALDILLRREGMDAAIAGRNFADVCSRSDASWEATKETARETYLWLPLGFNSETGNYQLDDLLMEAGGFDQLKLFYSFSDWQTMREVFEGLIIEKLVYLNELVEGK